MQIWRWGETSGVTWETADEATRESFALVRLYWYFRMRENGGPDGSELDAEVEEHAREAAEWFRPTLVARAASARAEAAR